MAVTDTHTSIEAVLLNSEGDPYEEIQAALDATAAFALLECECTKEGFLQAAEKAWRKAEKED